MDAWMDDHIPRLRQLHRHQILANALPPSGKTSNENRDICPKRQPERSQSVHRQSATPDAVQAQQNSSGIRAATAQAPTHGNLLLHPQRSPQLAASSLLQSASSSHGQISLRINANRPIRPFDTPILPHRDPNGIAQINELKNRLQLVIAIRTATRDMEEQVQFGRRRPKRFATPAATPIFESTLVATPILKAIPTTRSILDFTLVATPIFESTLVPTPIFGPTVMPTPFLVPTPVTASPRDDLTHDVQPSTTNRTRTPSR